MTMVHVLLLLLATVPNTFAQQTRKKKARINSHVGSNIRSPLPGFLNVEDYGAKKNNATFDNTVPFQNALDACSKANGGEVFAGAGTFTFKGSLTIPPGCTLSGTFTVVPSHDLRGGKKNINDGTVLVSPNTLVEFLFILFVLTFFGC